RGELPPVEFAAEARNERAARFLALQVVPTKARIDIGQKEHAGLAGLAQVLRPVGCRGLGRAALAHRVADVPGTDDIEAAKKPGPVRIFFRPPAPRAAANQAHAVLFVLLKEIDNALGQPGIKLLAPAPLAVEPPDAEH